ncbi:MAG: ABC transporter ATP-binding protein [Acidobacteriota bacterium]|nr:MAG: ABC transporter ATP-binding protein [Acidobacteriota bacterium]
MIRFENTSKSFGSIEALAPLDLEIRDGEWLGVFGRNGSGKTTLLRMLVGLSQPTSGHIRIDGTVPGPEDWRAFRRSLGFMPERVSLFDNLTGEKTLCYFARLKQVDQTRVMPILESVGLAEAAKQKTSGYSKGMRQRLNLAQALLGDPKFLVLDEPIEGLDAHGVRDFFELLKSVTGRTVVFSSHRLPLISRVTDRICILSKGKLKALGTEDELYEKVNLPVRIVIHPLRDKAQALAAAVNKLDFASLVSQNGRLVVSVAQKDKLQFLSELASLRPEMHDIRIEEPSLEEVLLETS